MSEPSEANRETPGAQTLRRGLSILKLLARYQVSGGLGVSEIARKLELSKATTVRLTRTLMDEQFVAQDTATRRYELGPESFAVGLAAEPNYALQRIAAPALRAVALETGDFVFFSVRQGLEVICLSRESGDLPYPQASRWAWVPAAWQFWPPCKGMKLTQCSSSMPLRLPRDTRR